jgi:hypothetical protein
VGIPLRLNVLEGDGMTVTRTVNDTVWAMFSDPRCSVDPRPPTILVRCHLSMAIAEDETSSRAA